VKLEAGRLERRTVKNEIKFQNDALPTAKIQPANSRLWTIHYSKRSRDAIGLSPTYEQFQFLLKNGLIK
jgi:hypothetical protein